MTGFLLPVVVGCLLTGIMEFKISLRKLLSFGVVSGKEQCRSSSLPSREEQVETRCAPCTCSYSLGFIYANESVLDSASGLAILAALQI